MKAKSLLTSLVAVMIFATLRTSILAQEQPKTGFPFYVRLTQQYQYPGTGLVSSAGMIEQVVNEDPDNFILSTPDGIAVKVPKLLVVKVSYREAANGMIAERATYSAQMEQAVAAMKQMVATVQQLQTEREQIKQAIQAAIAVREQQRSSRGSAQALRDELKAIREIQELMKKNP
jgi:hypothetical protein